MFSASPRVVRTQKCPAVCQVILWGRTEKCLKETAEEIALAGTECHYFVCDVANREEVYEQAKVVREKVDQPLRSFSHLAYR